MTAPLTAIVSGAFARRVLAEELPAALAAAASRPD
jgi:hypothetical protein